MLANLSLLNGKNEKASFAKALKPTKIKVSALTRKDCENVPAMAKYFVVNNKELDRFHIPEITAKEYEELAKEFKRTSRFDEKNLKFETATDYYIRKARVMAVAKDLGVSSSLIDTTDYFWDERYYTEFNFWHNVDVVEDAWREEGEDFRNASANKVYIAMEAKSNSIDMMLYDSLYKFCYTAIVNRKAMLLCKVDKCLSFLNSIAEYTNGFAENVSSAQRATLESYSQFFADLMANKDAEAFINSTNDIEVFANNESTHSDYVETYRAMLRNSVRCKGNELEFFRAEMSRIEDPYIDEILADEIDPEDCLSGAYLANEEDAEYIED